MENEVELWECATCGLTGICAHCELENKNE